VERISSEAALEYDGHPSEDFVHYSINGETLYVSKFFNPIPLTPEILEMTGFDKVTSMEDTETKFWGRKFVILLEVKVLKSGTTLKLAGTPSKIEYLHQLQNLYFAITGEEIDVDMDKIIQAEIASNSLIDLFNKS
jgi:hypothetical protein